LIYHPVRSDDPAIIELAHSIQEHGVLEPITITRDRYIVSGHRRYAATRLAGFDKIDCRVLPMDSSDPRFMELLMAFNQQRVKTLDEFMR
jgi:ParB family chromosome partitioning protein